MGTDENKQYNPMDHIQVADTSPRCGAVLDQRDITIQSYQTDIPFDYGRIDTGLDSAWLSPALNLGVIERSPRISDDACGVVLGLQGRVSVRVYDYDHRRPLWFNWMNAVVETISIRYFRDENGLLRFTTTGGGRRIGDDKLEDFNRRYLGIHQGAVTKRRFDLDRLRDLCFSTFVDRLYMVRFAGPSVEEYKSIDHALFQSKKPIDPDSGRLKEMRLDAKVKIELFESAVAVRSPDLSDQIQVRFLIKGSSGSLRLRFPRLPLVQQPDTVQEQAAVFYRVVDKAVNAILDESYYTSTVLQLADLDTEMEMFPDMVDLAPYRKILKGGKSRQDFFNTLDLGGHWKTWLPHLLAIDELVEAKAIAEDVSVALRESVKSAPLVMARLVGVCRVDAKMRRIGELTVRATAFELYNGKKVCCDPSSCKAEAETMANAYIDALKDAYLRRAVPFGGYCGNVAIDLLGGCGTNYPGDLYPGLVCDGWQGMATTILSELSNTSNCWKYQIRSSNNPLGLLLRVDAMHAWGSLRSVGGSVNLDPWPSGGWDYHKDFSGWSLTLYSTPFCHVPWVSWETAPY